VSSVLWSVCRRVPGPPGRYARPAWCGSRSSLHGNAAPMVGAVVGRRPGRAEHRRGSHRTRGVGWDDLNGTRARRIGGRCHRMGQESMWRDHNGRDGWLAGAAREGASGSVITRLTPQDASFYRLESSSNPIHIGSLAILHNTTTDSAGDGKGRPCLDYARLVDLVESRLSLVPRYRRKVREIPLSLGRPVWVEDSRFDINYHIRRSA